MNFEIIPIYHQDGIKTVNARELHAFLGVGKVFAAWIRERIEQYEFEEGKDFTISSDLCFPESESKKRVGRGGHNIKEYHITLDMAKELSMVERTHHGKLARRYFIECERRLMETPQLPRKPELVEEVFQARLAARMGNPIERAEAIGCLLEDGLTVREIIETLGCHQCTVYFHLALLKLNSEVQDAVKARKITTRTGANLASLDEQRQMLVLQKMLEKKHSEREALSLIRQNRN